MSPLTAAILSAVYVWGAIATAAILREQFLTFERTIPGSAWRAVHWRTGWSLVNGLARLSVAVLLWPLLWVPVAAWIAGDFLLTSFRRLVHFARRSK